MTTERAKRMSVKDAHDLGHEVTVLGYSPITWELILVGAGIKVVGIVVLLLLA